MDTGFVIRKNQYYDSVFLMGVSKRISAVSRVRQNAVLMGSEANKGLLSAINVQAPEIDAAQPSDLIVAVVADTPEVVREVLGRLDDFFLGGIKMAETSNPHSLEEGLGRQPGANLAVFSIPGEYAAREARKALEAGLNVFLFSDNVPVDEELELKQYAGQRNLLVMGPDCGSGLIGGVGLGFTNVVRRGSIGAICAAGTGLQEFTTQVHNAGGGISHAIGTGAHDMSDEIGGLAAFAALEALEADPATKVIAVISKPPGPNTLRHLKERFQTCRKPIVGCFLGTRPAVEDTTDRIHYAETLDDAVRLALEPDCTGPYGLPPRWSPRERERMVQERASWGPEQKYLRGLFAGGTFCYQAQQILRETGLKVRSNAPLDAKYKLTDSNHSREHTVVDLGADEFTRGRPHPMIDGTVRRQRILAEARDPQMAILLLDFILGYNASMDPAGELIDAILEAKRVVKQRGGALTMVASLCATEGDPQDAKLQAGLLEDAGVLVFRSSARAVSFCRELLRPNGGAHGN